MSIPSRLPSTLSDALDEGQSSFHSRTVLCSQCGIACGWSTWVGSQDLIHCPGCQRWIPVRSESVNCSEWIYQDETNQTFADYR